MKRNGEIAAAERHELISLNDKSLYICFQEYNRDGSSSWLIQAVNLSQLLLPSPPSCCSINGHSKLLRTVNRLTDHDLPKLPHCCVFGSKILFAGGGRQIPSRQVYVFETDPNVDPKLEIKKACFPSFVNEKYRTLLLVLDDGNLYAIGECPSLPLLSLEEFDPSEGKWSALPAPDPEPSLFQCMYATVGTNIIFLSSDPQVLYRFDAAAHRWTKHSTVDRLLSSGGRALVLNCDGDDGGFIMFTYSCWSHWDSIHVYQMSKEYEHLRHIESHQMPNHDQLNHDQFSPTRGSCHSYSFVHLGGRQVCLVLAYDCWYQEEHRLTIVVVMFEYAMADKKKNKNKKREEPESDSMGQFNYLATRLIEFDFNGHEEPYQCIRAVMLGAFVVPPPEPVPELLPQKHKADGVGTLFVTSPTKAAAAPHKKYHLNPAAKSFSPSAFNSNIVTYNHYTTETGMDGSQILQLHSVGRMVAPTSTLEYAHHYQYPYPFQTGTYPNSHSQAVFGHMGSWEPTLGFGIHGGNNGSQFLQQPTVRQMVAPTRTVRYVDKYQYPSQTGPYPNSHPQAIVGHMGNWASTLGYAPPQAGPAYPTSQTEAYLGHHSHDCCYPTFYQRYN